MKTAKQREQEFRDELKALLEKHRAEIEVTDDGRSYGMQSGVCIISMGAIYDKEGNVIEEYADFNL